MIVGQAREGSEGRFEQGHCPLRTKERIEAQAGARVQEEVMREADETKGHMYNT